MSASYIKKFMPALLALAFLLGACQMNVGTVELRLIYTADMIAGVSLNPLDRETISKMRVRIEGDDMSSREVTFGLGAHERGVFSDIPVGKNRVVTVEGVNTLDAIQSRGVSAPFETRAGNTKLYLFISLVGKFAPPPVEGTGEEEFKKKYRTTSEITRVFHTTTSLLNGEALVVGGAWHPSKTGFLDPLEEAAIRSAERFDPSAGAFVGGQASPDCIAMKLCMRASTGRAFHSTELLSGGSHALVIGGEPLPVVKTKPVEVFSTESETFDNIIEMVTPRSRHASAQVTGLREGVLVAGGVGGETVGELASIEFFENGNFYQLSELLEAPRSGAVAVSYPDNVLIIGGWEEGGIASKKVDHIKFQGEGQDIEPFDMESPRAEHSAVLVEDSDGKTAVFVCGGLWNDAGTIKVVDTCELLYPDEDRSVLLSGVSLRRWGHTATVLQNGKVLVAGGFDYFGDPLTAPGGAFLFPTPIGMESGQPIPTFSARAGHTATLLSNGMVVLIGGISQIDVADVPEETTSFDFPYYYYEIYNPRP